MLSEWIKMRAKVEFFKDTIKNTISMDITDIHALKTLPLKDAIWSLYALATILAPR